jgi:hypothetical protein
MRLGLRLLGLTAVGLTASAAFVWRDYHNYVAKTSLQNAADRLYGAGRGLAAMAEYCDQHVEKNPALLAAAADWRLRNGELLDKATRIVKKAGESPADKDRYLSNVADKAIAQIFETGVVKCQDLTAILSDPRSDLRNLSTTAEDAVRVDIAEPLAAAPPPLLAQRPPAYHWAANITIAPPESGKQRAETELATDNDGRVWLAYLDTDYQQARDGAWGAWPRRLTAVTSTDEGRSFTQPRVLSEMGGNAAIAAAPNGGVYVSWVQYSYVLRILYQKITVQHFDNTGAVSPPLQCPLWTKGQSHDQSALYVSNDGTVHVLGVDIEPPPPIVGVNNLGDLSSIYGRSSGNLETCSGEQRLGSIGQGPAITGTVDALFVLGGAKYLISTDDGHSFSDKNQHIFGGGVRAAVSPDRRTAYVVGDAVRGGLWLQATEDGGKTWRKARVDTAPTALAWRYPAIAVSPTGRVHIIWMDNRDSHGAVYHAYSDDGGRTFSENARVSDRPFYFSPDWPYPPPANQAGTWIGDYMSVTVVHDKVVAAWSDQRAGTPLSAVYAAVGAPEASP